LAADFVGPVTVISQMKRPRDLGVFLLKKASTRSGWPVHVRRQGGRQIEDDRSVFGKTGDTRFRFRAGTASASQSFVLRSFVVVVAVANPERASHRAARVEGSFVVARSFVVVRRSSSSFVVVVVRSSHVVRSLP
jgi:hypothetical protein